MQAKTNLKTVLNSKWANFGTYCSLNLGRNVSTIFTILNKLKLLVSGMVNN